MSRVGHLIVGPAGHGVVDVAEATAGCLAVRVATLADLPAELLAGADVVHIHYTDRLFGATVESAAAAFIDIIQRLDRPVTVSLHDLPMPGHEATWRTRREIAYSEISRAVAGIVVSSAHEARQVRGARPILVLPLPIDRLPDPAVRPTPSAEAGVLGWIYPGKGHAEVLAALPAGINLAALGAVSPGHDGLLRELMEAAGDRLRVTGYLQDGLLTAELRRVAVPIAPNRQVSGSASIGRWLAAGRRPLVAEGHWSRELDARCPGAVHIYAPERLSEAVADALADPDSTWLGDVAVGPSTQEVARRLAAFAESVL